MRPNVGTDIAKTENEEPSGVLRHRREAGNVLRPFLAVKSVEKPTVENRVERSPQRLQFERIGRSKLRLDPPLNGFLTRHRQRRLGHVHAEDRQAKRRDMEGVLSGSAARIEDRPRKPALDASLTIAG